MTIATEVLGGLPIRDMSSPAYETASGARGTLAWPLYVIAADGNSPPELVDRVCAPVVAIGRVGEVFDHLTAMSGGRGADWQASHEDRQRSLDTHDTPPPALGTDGERDVHADGGLQ
ncbi:hypothetical protein AB0E85_18510 [Streptomyces sp. NPDC029044]|uniref:hypothetical protein n=1 Tax=Streptomyces sp. NPDC029044 TaxID=3157198 RepID=UPI0033C98529